MEEKLQESQIRYEEKSLKVAAEMTHTVMASNRKSQKAFDAVRSQDKMTM